VLKENLRWIEVSVGRGSCLSLAWAGALAFLTLANVSGWANEPEGQVILEDSFERSESDDSKEQVGGGWSTNSKSRAQGQKQVDLVDGAMHIRRAEVADHGVSVVHDLEFKDATIRMRFRLRPQDELGINIADMNEKSVHAGHLCVAKFRIGSVEMMDLKTGNMKKETRALRQAGNVSEELAQMLKGKKKKFELGLKPNEWHDLEVKIHGAEMTVRVNDRLVGSFQSEGIDHPTKSRIRLAVPKQAWVDDVTVWRH